MQFLTLNQGYTKFNLLVKHNIKYDKIISLRNITGYRSYISYILL
jgi:hypothetical protein